MGKWEMVGLHNQLFSINYFPIHYFPINYFPIHYFHPN